MMPTNRKLAVGLVVSVGFNLFLAGALVMLLVMGNRSKPAPADGKDPMALFHLRRALGNNPRTEIRKTMRSHARSVRPKMQEVRAARGEVIEALQADPYDPKKLERALRNLHARTDESQTLMHKALLDVAGKLTASERQKLATANRRWKRGRGRGRGKKGGRRRWRDRMRGGKPPWKRRRGPGRRNRMRKRKGKGRRQQ